MKPDLFFYLTAGFNAGTLSSILLRMKDSGFLPSKKEIATLVLSGLAAASTIGYILTNKKYGSEEAGEEFIDTKEDTVKKMETLLV